MKALFFQRFPMVMLILLGCISIIFMMPKLQAEAILANSLEGVFFVYAVCALIWTRALKNYTGTILIFWSCTIYIGISYLFAVVKDGANVLDFLLIFKSFYYLAFLSFFTDKDLISPKIVLRLLDALLAIFFIKYLAMIVFGVSDRPIVYTENNFELMILYTLYLIRYSLTQKRFLVYLFLCGVITIVSLSRSCLLMYATVALFVVWDSYKKLRSVLIPIAVIVLGSIIYLIFSERSADLQSVDRYKFFLVFLDEIKNWGILQWLVGNPRITPLSIWGCQAMSGYQELYSYSGDQSCYSVILHAFLLRVLLDHGIIGLLFIYFASYYLLIKSGVKKKITLVFLAIVLLNGLSVSSFNNLFFALSMLFLMTMNQNSFTPDMVDRKARKKLQQQDSLLSS